MADHNTVVVGISTDKERRLRRLAKYFRYFRIDLPLASDSDSRVGGLFDVRRDTGVGNLRVTYVIDGEGTIRGLIHSEFGVTSHVEYALKTLEDLS